MAQVEIRSKQNTFIILNIIDMKGSLLETKAITNTKGVVNTSFDVSKLAKGNYLLNLYDEEGTASYPFVVN
ncbi:MAG: T9SS type A sorting domain-containing protein [Sphingobacteriales bacterium]|nr:T9SS type A sorting domain-containing protein [Sphingobacteriales bacterium]